MCIGNVHPCMFMCQTEWAREKGPFSPHSCQQLLKARLITGPLGKPYDYIHHLPSINLSLIPVLSLTLSLPPPLPHFLAGTGRNARKPLQPHASIPFPRNTLEICLMRDQRVQT